MKYLLASYAILLLVALSTCAPKVEAASIRSDARVVEHVLALHEIEDVTNALPEIRALWPEQLEAYTQCIKHVWGVLTATPTNEATTQALRLVFANVAESSIQWDREDRSSLLRLKCEFMLEYLNAPVIRDDISTWIDIASIVGDLRSRIVPNYTKQGQLNPPNVMQASSQEEAQLAIAENRKRLAADRLQQELRMTDRKLTLLLLNNVREVYSRLSEPQKEQVLGRIKSLARLNDDEMGRLK